MENIIFESSIIPTAKKEGGKTKLSDNNQFIATGALMTQITNVKTCLGVRDIVPKDIFK